VALIGESGAALWQFYPRRKGPLCLFALFEQ
jgi:hypothetical protein